MSEKTVVTDNDVAIFREWLVKQPFLPQYVEDDFIKCFIIGAKGSIQRAKNTFDNYFKSGQILPELFNDGDLFSEKSEKFNKTWAICNLPNRTSEGYLITVTRYLITDPTDFDFGEYFLRHFYNLHINLVENNIGNGEFVCILDTTGMQFAHFKTLTPALAEKLMGCVVNASPIRIKGVHILGAPGIIEWCLNIFGRLLPEKLRNRIIVHSNNEAMYKYIPKEILPSDFGGDEESVENLYGKHMEKMKGYRELLMKEASNRMEEYKLRPKADDDDLTGTFRKLQVD